jgi:glutamine---fructose-6-phosphate transaminase (isomerizing)
MEQPGAWRGALAEGRRQWPDVAAKLGAAALSRELIVQGCGSSLYLAHAVASQLRIAGRVASPVASSELLLHSQAALGPSRPYLLVSLSRSGETTEVVAATDFAKREHGVPALVETCYGGSSLARLGDAVLEVASGQEKSVVMTKSLTTELLAFQTGLPHFGGPSLDSELDRLPDALDRLLSTHGEQAMLAGAQPGIEKRVFLGSGPYYGLALEANLKMKEMAIVTSEVYHNLEFRHGPVSIVDDRTQVVVFVSDSGREYEVSLLAELKALGATLFVVCERAEPAILESADYLFELSSGVSEAARAALYLPLAHLLAYSCAVSRGENPDSPRNLTQVVKLAR